MQKYSGIITALVTPFYKGEVDYPSLKKLIQLQLDSKVQGFVVNGTTGESPCLFPEEVKNIFSFVSGEASTQANVILGTGSNSTYVADQKIKQAVSWGVKTALVVCPYYNKPSQAGLVQHFQYLAQQNKSINILLYNVPSRTGVSLDIQSLKTLSAEPNIIGIKEASGNIDFAKQIVKQKLFSSILSGDDLSFNDFMKVGGNGLVGVATHILGKEFNAVFKNTAERKNWETYLPLLKALYAETNPMGIKKALALLGIIKSAELRLPMVEGSGQDIAKELKKLGYL
ncbi:MAG: 4-hydroxy-tetrahydrodipicolinate synthase [Bdellovibrionaceae bacterium]|nr:4-hydroxy-tetrahydrodipicolinate synthase [Pseudobdellovibrionaceae bacterium]